MCFPQRAGAENRTGHHLHKRRTARRAFHGKGPFISVRNTQKGEKVPACLAHREVLGLVWEQVLTVCFSYLALTHLCRTPVVLSILFLVIELKLEQLSRVGKQKNEQERTNERTKPSHILRRNQLTCAEKRSLKGGCTQCAAKGSEIRPKSGCCCGCRKGMLQQCGEISSGVQI